ncbi:AAA family ATPase [Desulfovibrio sp. XJ01]|nr:AAA family ATPase [Nitratidesulfovibrio liaohensis]
MTARLKRWGCLDGYDHGWLVESGVVPTTWPGGRKGIACTDWSALKGREVLLLPSYAADGYRLAYEASRAIQKAGAGQVRILSRAPQWEFRGETERLAHDLAVWNDQGRRLSARAFCEEAERLFGLNLDGQVETAFQSKSLETLLAMPEEPRPYVIKPVMLSPGLMMLVAGTGVGKTWVAFAVALAVWKGTSALGGKWTASRARNVLYLDGEMGESACKERLKALGQAQRRTVDEEIGGKRFELLSTMTEGNALPDLGTEEGGEALLGWIDKRFPDVEFIVFDNLSTLAPTACGNSTECQEEFRTLLKKLKARGISCLIVQHTSKSGDQRGSNAKLDILDAVVKLDRPSKKGTAEKTTRITVSYEKCRNAFGSDIEPFTVELSPPDGLLATSPCEGQTKKSAPDVDGLQPAWLENAKRMREDGMSYRQLAHALAQSDGSGPTHETVRKWLQKIGE